VACRLLWQDDRSMKEPRHADIAAAAIDQE
jgi:hypothetical protein